MNTEHHNKQFGNSSRGGMFSKLTSGLIPIPSLMPTIFHRPQQQDHSPKEDTTSSSNPGFLRRMLRFRGKRDTSQQVVV